LKRVPIFKQRKVTGAFLAERYRLTTPIGDGMSGLDRNGEFFNRMQVISFEALIPSL